MRGYEELVKALRETRETVRENPSLAMRVPPYQLNAAADAIEELQKLVDVEKAFSDVWEENANECRARFQKLLDAFPKWISVEERLPEFDQKVLAWVKNKDPEARFNHDGIYIAELKDRTPEPDPEGKKNFWGIPGYDSEWTVWAWSYFSEPEVTHWMPMPEPPKEDDNG